MADNEEWRVVLRAIVVLFVLVCISYLGLFEGINFVSDGEKRSGGGDLGFLLVYLLREVRVLLLVGVIVQLGSIIENVVCRWVELYRVFRRLRESGDEAWVPLDESISLAGVLHELHGNSVRTRGGGGWGVGRGGLRGAVRLRGVLGIRLIGLLVSRSFERYGEMESVRNPWGLRLCGS